MEPLISIFARSNGDLLYLGEPKRDTMSLIVLVRTFQSVGLLLEGILKVPSRSVYLEVTWDEIMLRMTNDWEVLIIIELFYNKEAYRLVFQIGYADVIPDFPLDLNNPPPEDMDKQIEPYTRFLTQHTSQPQRVWVLTH